MKTKAWPLQAFVQAHYADAQGNPIGPLNDRQDQPDEREAPYRLLLDIQWSWAGMFKPKDAPNHTLVFCGANPSTATAKSPDPTLEGMVLRADLHGFKRLLVVNQSPFRATDPKDCVAHLNALGPAWVDLYTRLHLATRARMDRNWCCSTQDGKAWAPPPFKGNGAPTAKAPAKDCAWVYAWGDCLKSKDWTKALTPVLLSVFPYDERPVYCFGVNNSGTPKHPLYLKADTPLIDFAKPGA